VIFFSAASSRTVSIALLTHARTETRSRARLSLPLRNRFSDQAKISKALSSGKEKVFCPDCGKPIPLRDLLEEKFDSLETVVQARILENEARIAIDNESRRLILTGHIFSIVAEAGQIYRADTKSKHGTDGEIEFVDNQGRPSGKHLYVQLQSSDPHLAKHGHNGPEILLISNPEWVRYWQQQPYTLMLVMQTSSGKIHWMDVTTYLKRENAPEGEVNVFKGELFDAKSVSEWRKKVLET
jgi:Domain of unknown function (DUF4365)